MLAKRNELEKYLRRKCDVIAFDKEQCQKICSGIETAHKVPASLIMDIITKRKEIDLATDFELFCLTEQIQKGFIVDYFTEIEIKNYTTLQWQQEDNISFPIRIPCYPLGVNGWLGTIDVDTLYGMYRQQFIHYNENTQRVLVQKVRGKDIYWTIDKNDRAVNEIEKRLDENTYIPTVLSFNLEEDAEYYYDPESKELVITECNYVDVIDGYHRCLALWKKKRKDPDYQFTMGVFITYFSEEKAKRYIFQEDQKTKMKRADSASMNTDADENIVVEKLNEDMNSNLKGCIGRQNCIINYATLSILISKLYFKDNVPKERKTYRLAVTKELKERFNLVIEEYPQIIEEYITNKELLCYITAVHDNETAEDLIKVFKFLTENKERINALRFSNGVESARNFKLVRALMQEV